MRIFKSKLFITILIFILTFGGIAGGITAVNSISGNENVYADEENYSFSKITENVVRLFNKDTAPSAILDGNTDNSSTGTSTSSAVGEGGPDSAYEDAVSTVDATVNKDHSWFTKGIGDTDMSRVGNFGAFMGYAREGIVMWITSLIAMGKVTFTYDQLASVTGMTADTIVHDDGNGTSGAIDSNPLWMYSQYGKVLKEMGLDQNRSSGIVGALLMFVKLIGGVFLLLVYLFSMLVPAVFSLVATFLRYFNPFTFMVSVPGIYEVYKAFYSFGRWIAAPLFLALMFVGIYVFGPKGANIHGDQASFSSKLFKFIKRFAFIILGIPLIGFLYTIAINNLAENLGNMGTGFADRMLAHNMIDFGQWAAQERLAIPSTTDQYSGLEVEVDDSKNKIRLVPTLDSLNKVRGYAYAINKQTGSVGQEKDKNNDWTVNPDEENAITKYQSTEEGDSGAVQKLDSNGDWKATVRDQQASADETKRGSTGLEAVLGYMLSNVYTAAAFESDTKAELLRYMNETSEENKKKISTVLKWYATEFTKYDGNGPIAGLISGNDNQGRFYDLFKIDKYEDWSNNIMVNGGLEIMRLSSHSGKLYFYNNSGIPGEGEAKTIGKDEGYRVLDFSGLSSMSMYNYLTTNFGSDSMDVYASADNSSDFVKEEHLSVHMVGQTFFHRALLLFQVIVMLLCMTIIGLVYGFAVLFANIKRGFQIIFNMPFMLVGSLQAAAKVVIYTVVLFLEVFGTMFLYSVVENMFGAVMDVSMSMLEDVGTDLKLEERSNKTIESLPKLMNLRSDWVDNYDPSVSASNVQVIDSGYTYSELSGLVANNNIEADLADISTNSLDDAYAYAATGTSYAQNGVAIKMLFGPIVTIVVGIIFTVISIKYRKVIVQSLEEMIANVIQKLVVGSGSAPPVTGGSGGGMGKALLGGAAAGAAGVLARAAGGGGKGGDKAGDNAGNVEEANSKAAAKAEDSKDGGGKGSKGSGEKQVGARAAGIPGPVAGKAGAGGKGGESEEAAGGGDNSHVDDGGETNTKAGVVGLGKDSLNEDERNGKKLSEQTGDLAQGSGEGKGKEKDGASGQGKKESDSQKTASDKASDTEKKNVATGETNATSATNTKGSTTEDSEAGAGGTPGAGEADGTLAASEDQKGLGQESQEAPDNQTSEGEAASEQPPTEVAADGDPAKKDDDSASETPADDADGAGDNKSEQELAKGEEADADGTPEKGNSKQGFTDKAINAATNAAKHPVQTAANIGKGIAAGAVAALGGAAGVEAIKNAKGLGGKLKATAQGLKQGASNLPSAIANSAAGRYANNVANQAKAVKKSAGGIKEAANARRSAIEKAGNAKQAMKDALKTGGKDSQDYINARDAYKDAKKAARKESGKALTSAFATAGNAIKTAGKAVAPAAKVAGDMAKAGMQVGAGTMVAGIGAYTGNIGLIAHGARMGMDGIGRNEGHLRQAVDNAADRVSFMQAALGAGVSGTSWGSIFNTYQNMQATGGLEQRTQNTDHDSGGIHHSSGGTTTGGNTVMQPGVSGGADGSTPIQPQAPVGQTTESRVNTPRGNK